MVDIELDGRVGYVVLGMEFYSEPRLEKVYIKRMNEGKVYIYNFRYNDVIEGRKDRGTELKSNAVELGRVDKGAPVKLRLMAGGRKGWKWMPGLFFMEVDKAVECYNELTALLKYYKELMGMEDTPTG